MKRNSILLVALLGLAPAAFAQNQMMFLGSGASAMFETGRLAAGEETGLPQFPATGDRYDAYRVGITVTEGNGTPTTGVSFVVVTGNAGNRRVWVYVQLDSAVGVRQFFTNARITAINQVGTVATPFGRETSAAPALVVDETQDMPADVVSFLLTGDGGLGQPVTAGMTDVSAIDAKVAHAESLQGGYNNTTNPIRGLNADGLFLSRTNVIDFSLSARPYQTRFIGAAPILVFVNRQDTTPGGFGWIPVSERNMNLQTYAGFMDGQFTSTSDVYRANVPGKPVATFLREMLSGTYITNEWCGPRSLRGGTFQDNPAVPNPNPLNEANWSRTNAAFTAGQFTQGGRVRAISTGPLVRAVNRTPNAMGYSFWSTGTFSPVAGTAAANTYYLTLDGLDPVRDNYTDGTYPVGSEITFRNVINGSYPIWGILRSIVAPNAPASVISMLNRMTTSADASNFVALANLRVFRSHRTVPAEMGLTSASNGIVTGTTREGADAGGLVFTTNNELNFNLLTGGELTERRQ